MRVSGFSTEEARARFGGNLRTRAKRALDGVLGLRSAAQTISPARIATGRSFSAGGYPHSYSSVYAQ